MPEEKDLKRAVGYSSHQKGQHFQNSGLGTGSRLPGGVLQLMPSQSRNHGGLAQNRSQAPPGYTDLVGGGAGASIIPQ
jgi:hypothetical protein